MLELLIVVSTWFAQIQASARAIDVSTITVGSATTVTELDLGQLKGELRQIGWSPDGEDLYIQTAEGGQPSVKLRHYTVPAAGGLLKGLDTQPEWAERFWSYKSDRFAPGIGSLMINVDQKVEKTKVGTGSGRPGATGAGGLGDIGVDVEKTSESQRQQVVRLVLLGEAISEFVNGPMVPGLMFSWGPESSGAIAFTDRDGRLMLLDQQKHKKTVSGARDALLPAWSIDGSRLAWVQKSGRKKYTLVWSSVSR